MKSILIILFIYTLLFFNTIQSQEIKNKEILLIRCDDIGMSHSVNMAFNEVAHLTQNKYM